MSLHSLRVGKVDVLINNAGTVFGDTLLELSDSAIETTYKVNILSHYWVKTRRKVISVRMHQMFNEHTMENDIAVVVVRRDFPLGENVKRVIITEQYPLEAWYGYVAGWGIFREDLDNTSMILKHVGQHIRSKRTCSVIGHLHEGMFCAGSRDKESPRPAKGDSGSALVTGNYNQIGLVSFRIRSYPALMVYTNVTYYYKWVQYNTRRIYCQYEWSKEERSKPMVDVSTHRERDLKPIEEVTTQRKEENKTAGKEIVEKQTNGEEEENQSNTKEKVENS